MRIAQVAPLYERVPPLLYGGTERVVSYLTEELVRHGHQVTLYATSDSETSAKLVPVCKQPLWREPTCKEALPHHVRMVQMVANDAHRYDVIHFHLDYVHFPIVSSLPCASITTLHGPLHAPDESPLFEYTSELKLVSISNSQRRPIPQAHWQSTIYHGLPLDLHQFSPKGGDYLAFLGRMSSSKGIEEAIQIAQLVNMPLKIAANIYPDEQGYFETKVRPLLDAYPKAEFLGEVGGRDKDEFLGRAKCLLFPINWEEPFGLVMIESLACGTPVIAFRRGSVEEVLEDGKTAFIVDTVQEAVDAIGKLNTLSRQVCRQVFEERFDAARMAQEYIDLYRRLVSDCDSSERQPSARAGQQNAAPPLRPSGNAVLGPITFNDVSTIGLQSP